MRPWNVLAAAVLIAGLAAGCSSSPSPAPSPTGAALAADRMGYADALVAQCTLTRGLMQPPTGLVTPTGQTPWLEGTKLVITSANQATFNQWFAGVNGIVIAGRELGVWALDTADSGKLPEAVCGSSVTASELQKQVFAGDPAAGDPWP